MKWLLLLAGLAVAGCQSVPPKQTEFVNHRTYSFSKEEAWSRLLTFFTSNNIQIKTIEKDSGVIYAERAAADATMADCGADPMFITTGGTASLNVFVQPEGAGTKVTVNTKFTVTLGYDNRFWTVDCYSKGTLEKLLLDSIGS